MILTLINMLFAIAYSYSQWTSNGNNIFPSSLSSRVLIGTKSDADSASLTINTNRSYNAYGNQVAIKISGNDPYIFFNDSRNVQKAWIGLRQSNGGDFIISNNPNNQTGRIVLRTYQNSNIEMITNSLTRMIIDGSGNVAMGSDFTNPNYKLEVKGSIRAYEVLVQTGWSDYVFDKNYQLRSLSDVEKYIAQNKHLPDVPSAAEVETNGVQVGQMDSILIKKVEELTLYIIDQNKQIQELQRKVSQLKKMDADKKNQ